MTNFIISIAAIYTLLVIYDIWAEEQGLKDKENYRQSYFDRHGKKLKRKK